MGAAAGAPAAEVSLWRAGPANGADDLAARVLARVEEHTRPVELVLDDYHTVASTDAIGATVRRVLNDRPSHLRIAIAARETPGLPLARLRAQGLVATLDGRALAFTRGEAALALTALELDEAQLEAIFQLTGGWPAAVQLLGEAWAAGAPTALHLVGHGQLRTRLFDAFVQEEVLARLATDDLELLARLSVLDEVDAFSCALLGGEQAFERVGALAERFSFLTEVADNGDTSFRIHPLVRRLLQQRLSPTERSTALASAVDAFEHSGRPIEAGRAAIALGDRQRLAQLLRSESTRLIAQGRTRTLVDGWAQLPVEWVEADPALLVRRAQLEGIVGTLADASAMFERAVSAFLAAGQPRAAANALRVLAGLCEQQGNYHEARAALSRAVELLPEDDPALSLHINSLLATLRLHDADPQGALTLARQVVERAARQHDPTSLSVAQHNLGYLLSALGELAEAEQVLKQALELKRQLALGGAQVVTLNSLGLVYLRQGRLADAEATFGEAIHLAEASRLPAVQSYALSNLGDVYSQRGELERAEGTYTRSLELKASLGSRFALAHTWNSLAGLWRQAGDLDRARAFNTRALALRAGEADPIERLLYRTEAARIDLAAGAYAATRTEPAAGAYAAARTS